MKRQVIFTKESIHISHTVVIIFIGCFICHPGESLDHEHLSYREKVSTKSARNQYRQLLVKYLGLKRIISQPHERPIEPLLLYWIFDHDVCRYGKDFVTDTFN